MNYYTLKTTQIEINKIFNYACGNKFNKKNLNDFFDKNYSNLDKYSKKKIKKEFSNFSFYDIKNYNPTIKNVDKELYELMVDATTIKYNLIKKLFPEKKEEMQHSKGFIRKVSPPLEAYDNITYNKMNIKNSGRSHGLLFE